MPRLLIEHLALSALASAGLAAWFGLALQSVIGHVVVVALGQASVLAFFMASRVWWPGAGRLLLVALPHTLLTAQAILYLLQAFSYSYWGRSMTAQIVLAYLPGVLDGTEPLPVGPTVLLISIVAVAIAQFVLIPVWAPVLAGFVERHATHVGRPARRALAVGTLTIWALTGVVVVRGAISDSPVWYSAPFVSFVRGNPVVFEPTERRRAVGDADDALRETYPRDTAGDDAPHLILIVVDSLRADHMSAYGYPQPTTPFLDSLVAAGAHRVERVMATCPESYCGITSLLTSRPFRDITVRNFKLQEALGLSGYTPVFLLSGLHAGWYNMGQFYGGGPQHVMDGRQENGFGLSDDRQVLAWIEHLPSPPPAPAFLYIHLMSVHEVGHLQPEYASLQPAPSSGLAAAPLRRVSLQRYDARIRQADAIIEEIFGRLDGLGYLDNAVTVVTSDHGEALGRRHVGHGFELYDEALRIPLIIHDPRGPGYATGDYATHIDVAPTLVARAGLPVPPSWAGRSLLDPPVERMTVHQTYFSPERYAVVWHTGTRTWKYMVTPALADEHLYDLTADPSEDRDLIAEADPAVLARLRARLDAYLSGADAAVTMAPPPR